MQRSLFLLIVMGQCSFLACREYHFIEDRKTWHDAQKYCRDKYTDLATVFNMADMRKLQKAAEREKEAWIGLYNETNGNKTWHWSLPGTELNKSETNWRQLEPNDEESNEDCVEMEKDRLWNYVPCTEKRPFMCYDGRSNAQEKFILVAEEMCWTEAQEYCRKKYTDLVSGLEQLHHPKLITLLGNAKKKFSWLFGLFRDTWRWSDGNQSSFRYWDHHPDSGDCAMTTLWGENKWKSDNCSSLKPFFCYDWLCPELGCWKYHFIEDKKTWHDAQQYCRDEYTDLATVFNMRNTWGLQKAAKKQKEAWIGLYNEADGNKTWHWSLPGVEFNESETNWRQLEPNVEESNEDCVEMEKDRLWNYVSCTEKRPFMCYNGRSNAQEKFILVAEEMCWTEAQEYCRKKYTDLVSGLEQLNDQELITLLEKATEEFSWLFGLFRDTWRWSDGNQSSFRYWDHHPDSGDCAMTTLRGENKWKSDNCSSLKPFFCYDNEVILIKENKTWEDALYYCREHHYDLMSITDPHQQRMVQERAKRANSPFVWVGLRYTCTLDFWFWVTDQKVDYNKWASDGKIDDCDVSGAVDRGGHEWFSKNDSMEFNFICWI